MNPERIFADTNLFLRYLTNDLPEQASAIEQVLRQAMQGEITLVTSSLVIAEIVWTLESYYKLPPKEVQEMILAILNTPGLEVENADLALQAMLWHADKHVDYADAWNAAWIQDHGIETVYTFDSKHFQKFESLHVLVPGIKG